LSSLRPLGPTLRQFMLSQDSNSSFKFTQRKTPQQQHQQSNFQRQLQPVTFKIPISKESGHCSRQSDSPKFILDLSEFGNSLEPEEANVFAPTYSFSSMNQIQRRQENLDVLSELKSNQRYMIAIFHIFQYSTFFYKKDSILDFIF